MSNVFRAREAFAFTGKDGVPRIITPDTLMSDADPDYKGKEHLFEPVDVAMARAQKPGSNVEETTAAPGEKRSLSTSPRQKPGGSTGTADKPADSGAEK